MTGQGDSSWVIFGHPGFILSHSGVITFIFSCNFLAPPNVEILNKPRSGELLVEEGSKLKLRCKVRFRKMQITGDIETNEKLESVSEV